MHSRQPLSSSSHSNSSTPHSVASASTVFAADGMEFIGEGSQYDASETNTKHDAELARVNQQIALYRKKIHKENERLEKINERISANEVKLLMHQSPTQHGVDGNAASMKRHITSLENRLNQSLVAFNTKVAANKELRKKIDELRKERVRFDEIYTELEYNIQANTAAMTKVLEDGKKRIKSRDKAIDELEVLQMQLKETTEALRLDKEELARLQEHFRNKEEKETLHAFRAATAHSQQSEAKSYSQVQDSEECNHEEMLDEAFEKLKELTGIDDSDVLCEKLNQLDEQNFSQFNYTQELEAESDALEQQINEAKRELERLKCGDFNVGSHKQKEASLAEEKQKELQDKLEEVDQQYQNKLDVWQRVKTSIQTACSELDVSM